MSKPSFWRSETRVDEVKNSLVEFAESTSAHGPPKIVGHKYMIAKLFWTLLFLTGIVVFIYFSYQLIVAYLKYESTTDIELKFHPLEFPAVTVCNLNQFRKDRLPKGINDLIQKYTDSKRHALFGGEKNFVKYFASNPTEKPLVVPGWEESTPANAATTGRTTSNPVPGKRRRKKRNIVKITDKGKLKVLENLRTEEFFLEPNMTDISGMTWFTNDGETSANKEILLNLTHYINSISSERTLIEFGHEIQEMLQECSFQGKNCAPDDFRQFYDNRYGNCYTFNSGMDDHITKVSSPGAAFGLDLTLFINQPMYVPVLSPQAGIRVLLHRQGEVPLVADEGFDVAPGLKTSVAVKYVEVQRLTAPQYTNCTDMSVDGGQLYHPYYPGNYTQKACLKSCIQNATIKECDCVHPFYRGPRTLETCNSKDYNDCVEGVETELLENETCLSRCPLPCWESQYQPSISISQWPSISYQPYLVQTLKTRGKSLQRVLKVNDTDRSGLSQEFVKLEVYFDNLNYYKYKETASMSVEDLVGALGGHLGLWIGMSIISFVEVFELIVVLFGVCISAIRGKKNKTCDSAA